MTIKNRITVITLVMLASLIVFNVACKKEGDDDNDPSVENATDYSVKKYYPTEAVTDVSYISMEIQNNEANEHLYFGSHFNASLEPLDYSHFSYLKEGDNMITNIIYNDEKPSIIYQTDISNGENDNLVYCFSDFDNNSVVCNIYDYNWNSNSSSWLKGVKFIKNSDNFTFSDINIDETNLTFSENTIPEQPSTHEELFNQYTNNIVFELVRWLNTENNYEEVFQISANRNPTVIGLGAIVGVAAVVLILDIIKDQGTSYIFTGIDAVNSSAEHNEFWDWINNNIGIANASASEVDPNQFRIDDDGDGVPNIFDECPNEAGNSPSGCSGSSFTFGNIGEEGCEDIEFGVGGIYYTLSPGQTRTVLIVYNMNSGVNAYSTGCGNGNLLTLYGGYIHGNQVNEPLLLSNCCD